MTVSLTRPVSTVIADNTRVDKGPMRDLINDLIGAINGIDPLLFPSYPNRAAAETGLATVPAAVQRAMQQDGTALLIRSRGASSDDPLFPTGARWGVMMRIPDGATIFADTIAKITDAGVIRLITRAESTGSAIVADRAAGVEAVPMTTTRLVRWVQPATNTEADPLMSIPGAGTPWRVRDTNGDVLPANSLIVGRTYEAVIVSNGIMRLTTTGLSMTETRALTAGLAAEQAKWVDRGTAIAAETPSGYTVPASTTTIITIGGAYVGIWQRSSQQSNPVSAGRVLTENNGYWIRVAQLPKSELLQSSIDTILTGAGVTRLVPAVGSTADAMVMTTATGAAVTTDGLVRWIQAGTTTTPTPSATIAGVARTIRDVKGGALPIGGLVDGATYIGRIYNATQIRLVTAGTGLSDIAALQAGTTGNAAQLAAQLVLIQTIAAIAAEARQLVDGRPAPGDAVQVVVDLSGKTLLGVDQEGRTHGDFVITFQPPVAPGDFIAGYLWDLDGEMLAGIDIRDGSPWPREGGGDGIITNYLEIPAAPGDYIAPLVDDLDGQTLFGMDVRDGSIWPQPGGGSGGGGAAVEFVDPDNRGEAWMATRSGGVTRYLSNQWRGETWGFEKQGDITLAQTHDLAVGIVAFGGGGAGISRALVEDYKYHLVDEAMTRPETGQAAQAIAASFLNIQKAAVDGMPTVIALTQAIGSPTEAEALPGSVARLALIQRVQGARTALMGWGKDLFIDRISLSLLEGAQQTNAVTADWHYAAVAEGLREELATAAMQAPLPLVTVMQSIGTRTDGRSEVILAEGNLDWAHFALGIIVVGPRYPYALQPGAPAAMTAEAALMVSELEAIAVHEKQNNRNWFGPSMAASCTIAGSVVTVPFTAMTPLVLRDPVNHGFAVDGITNGATITGVTVAGGNALIAFSVAPLGDLIVRYAFGETGERGDSYACNRGSLTDSWSEVSRHAPSFTHYRYARSGRAPVIR